MVRDLPEEFLERVGSRKGEIRKTVQRTAPASRVLSPAGARPELLRLLSIAKDIGPIAANYLGNSDRTQLVQRVPTRRAGLILSAKYRQAMLDDGWFVASGVARSYSFDVGNRSEPDFGTVVHEALLTPRGALVAYRRDARHNTALHRPLPGFIEVGECAELGNSALPTFGEEEGALSVAAIEAGLIEFCAVYDLPLGIE
jgi:hypothetical protein